MGPRDVEKTWSPALARAFALVTVRLNGGLEPLVDVAGLAGRGGPSNWADTLTDVIYRLAVYNHYDPAEAEAFRMFHRGPLQALEEIADLEVLAAIQVLDEALGWGWYARQTCESK